MPNEFTVKFTFDRETKNAVRFKEDGAEDSQKVGYQYIKKSALDASVGEGAVVEATFKVTEG